MEGIRELLKDADKNQVAGISFGGQMHGLVILDEKDQVIRPAILWNDGRTTEECDYLNNVIRQGEAVGVYRKYLLYRFYRTKDPLGEKE